MEAFLISGAPGAGKTTVARLLAARFDRAAHLEGDLISFGFIVSGVVPPQGPPADEAARQLQLRRRNACLLANSFAEAGFVPVIDDVLAAPAVLDLYLSRLSTPVVRLVQLVPSLDVIEARDAARDKHVFHMWKHLHHELHTNMPRIGLWLDTSALTAAETVDAILANADAAVIRE
jgi:hypothetical protein